MVRLEPGLADTSAHRRGAVFLRELEGQGPAGALRDWVVLHGKPGPHWALQLARAEKSEAATSSANELPH